MNSFRTKHRARRRRDGVTLIELLVATAGLVVVLGLTLMIYGETRDASALMQRRQAAVDYGLQVIDEIAPLIAGAAAPDHFDLTEPLRPVFEADRLVIPSFREDSSAGLYMVALQGREDPDNAPSLERLDRPVDDATGSAPVGESTRTIGGAVEGFTPNLSFRYAIQAAPGKPVAYVESLEPDVWPALIEVNLRLDVEGFPTQPVEFQTALIPGYLSADEKAIPTPTPLPAGVGTQKTLTPEEAMEILEPASSGRDEPTTPTLEAEQPEGA